MQQLPAQVDLPAVERAVLERWERDRVFARSLEQTAERRAVGLLRGPADRERQAGHPPRRGARLQGPVPALQDDAGTVGAAQGRLGLPRPARRAGRGEGARLLRQAGHRGLRRRGVQRQVPRERAAPRRRVRAHDDAHGLLVRHGRRLPHDGRLVRRERLVVAQADRRQGPARRGPPRRAVLPPLRHRAVRPRGGPGLPDGDRPVGVRPLPGHERPVVGARCCTAGVDDDAVDAGLATPPWRCTPTSTYVAARAGERGARGGRAAARRARATTWRCSSASRAPRWSTRRTRGRSTWSTGLHRGRALRRPGRRTSRPSPAPAWSTSPPPSAPTTWPSPAATACRWSTRCGPTAPSRSTCRWSAGSSSRPPTRRSWTTCEPAACCSASSRTSTATRTAGAATPRCSTTRCRAGTSAPRRSRTGCSRRTSARPGTPRPSSTAGTATGSRTTSTGRCRATATGARRCRSGGARPTPRTGRPTARSPSSARTPGRSCRGSTRTGPSSTTSSCPAFDRRPTDQGQRAARRPGACPR